MNDELIIMKKNIRKRIRELKKELSETERRARSLPVLRKLETLPEFLSANIIFIFWSMEDEIDTRDFIVKWSDRKKFILPSVNGVELLLKEFNSVNELVAGDIYSIPEPDGIPFDKFDDIGLAIIPGIAFDRKNNRLGRGKGYYDRILHKLKGRTPLIGICYDFQMVDEVPVESHDIKMDGVICG
ncbi:MAG TPA: 5-formyltetrahydrofolate cyclo-ligase [Clostridiales bacterium]|nr:5-formyltetrahydrofolate cyclo-ligase [Clostridiales bacterium]